MKTLLLMITAAILIVAPQINAKEEWASRRPAQVDKGDVRRVRDSQGRQPGNPLMLILRWLGFGG